MLLKRDNEMSKSCTWFYQLNANKTIILWLGADRSVDSIGLVDARKPIDVEKDWHDLKTLCYAENITVDDGELLNVDALLDLARREDGNA